jgi:hypothetical protein
VVNQQGTQLLIEEPMVILNAQYGRAKVTLPTDILYEIQQQPASYSITRQSGNLTEAVFTNAKAGARAPVEITNSVFPQFVPSSPLTIPTTEITSETSFGGASYQQFPGANPYWGGNPNGGGYYNSWLNTEFFSSFIEPRGPVTTIQMDLIGYTGTIKVQAAENYQSIWYNVTESTTYYNEYRTITVNVVGWYPLLRVAFNNSLFATPLQPGVPALAYAICPGGQIENVILTNSGQGYLAPPVINFIGDGAGATAEAIMTPNVDSISITYPGSGYAVAPEVVLTGSGKGATATCTIDGTGAVDSITITNPGHGYITGPTVTFVGACTTAAQATTTANTNGQIVSINVTNPGSGYWPLPYQNPNGQPAPVPALQQGAIVAISTGYVVNLKYR